MPSTVWDFPVVGRGEDGAELGLSFDDAVQLLDEAEGSIKARFPVPKARHRGWFWQPSQHRWGVMIAEGAASWVVDAAHELTRIRADERDGAFSYDLDAEVIVVPLDPLQRQEELSRLRRREALPGTVLVLASMDELPLRVEHELLAHQVIPGRLWFDADLTPEVCGATPQQAVERYVRRLADISSRAPAGASERVILSHPYERPGVDPIVSLLPKPRAGVGTTRVGGGGPDSLLGALEGAPRLWLHVGGALHSTDGLRNGSLFTRGEAEPLDPRALVDCSGGVAALVGCYTGGNSTASWTMPALTVAGDDGEKARKDVEKHRARRDHMSATAHGLLGGERGFGAVVAGFDQLFRCAFNGQTKLGEPDTWTRMLDTLLVPGATVAKGFALAVEEERRVRGDLFPLDSSIINDRSFEHVCEFLRWSYLAQLRILGDPWVVA